MKTEQQLLSALRQAEEALELACKELQEFKVKQSLQRAAFKVGSVFYCASVTGDTKCGVRVVDVWAFETCVKYVVERVNSDGSARKNSPRYVVGKAIVLAGGYRAERAI